jgi:hypothetical protein
MSNAAGVLASIAGGVVANLITSFTLHVSVAPPSFLRVTNGSVLLKKAHLANPVQHDAATGAVLIQGETIEFSWPSQSRIHVGASLVAGAAVFAILLWLLVLD